MPRRAAPAASAAGAPRRPRRGAQRAAPAPAAPAAPARRPSAGAHVAAWRESRPAAGAAVPDMPAAAAVTLERTRDAQHGDFATNVALRLAKSARRNPRELAAAIVAALPPSELVARAEVAGAGFINFHLSPAAYARELAAIHARGAAYGTSGLGAGERVLLEFVSANPTGPLHVGHGRQAAFGATLANILAACGYAVEREYYINDAGRQMDILAVSTWVRYLESLNRS